MLFVPFFMVQLSFAQSTNCTTTLLNEPFNSLSPNGVNAAILYGDGGSNHESSYILSGSFFGWFNVVDNLQNLTVYNRNFSGANVGCQVSASIFIRQSFGNTNVTLSLIDGNNSVIDNVTLNLTNSYQQITLSGTATTSNLTYRIFYNSIGGPGNDVVTEDLLVRQTCNVNANINAGTTTQCLTGNNFVLNANQSTASSGINNFSWNFGDGNTTSGVSVNHAYSSPGNYTITQTTTDQSGCSNSETINVTVNPLPQASISGDISVCPNDPQPQITFTGSNSAAPYTFFYSINGGAQQSVTSTGNAATVNASTNTVGVYNYELISVTDASSTSCSQPQTGTATVTVNTLPQATLFGDSEVCQDDTEPQITFVGSNTVAPYTFTYTINGGAQQTITSTNDSAFVNVPTNIADTFVYELIDVTDASSAACSQLQTAVATVIVNPLPLATISGNIEVCQNEVQPQVTFNGSNTISPYIYTYTINGGAQQTVTSNGNTATVSVPTSLADTFRYELISVTDAGTLACSNLQPDTVTVFVNPLPSADWTFTNVCLGESTEFLNLSTVPGINGSIIDTWNWDFDNGTTSVMESPTTIYSQDGIFNAQLVVTTNKGCEDSLAQNISVWPLPQVDFSASQVCLGNNTVFTNQSTVSNSSTSNVITDWNWLFGDGVNSNAENPAHVYNADGTFNVTLTATTNNGCESSEIVPVVVHPLPEASFSGVNLEGCVKICPDVVSTSTINNPSQIVNYDWSLSNGQVLNGIDPNFTTCLENTGTNTNAYTLSLTVTSNEGCQDTQTEIDFIEVYHEPIASFSYEPENPDILNSEVDFVNMSAYASNYFWSFENIGTSTSMNPSILFPEKSASYDIQMVAITQEGCTDTTQSVIEILDRILFYIPNTFTPDLNMFNEVFQPVFHSGYDPQDFKLLIYNRWGEVMFESNDTSIGWDGVYGGKRVKEGTYIWKIEFQETMSDQRHIHSGHVNLLR